VSINSEIDGCFIENRKSSSQKNKFLIYSNANGVCYEHVLLYTNLLKDLFQCNVLVYNYRGVGHSKGICNHSTHMVEDLINVCEYCLTLSANSDEGETELILWGHSIGAAVTILACTYLKEKFPQLKISIVADRSFSSLEKVVEEKIGQGPLAPLISGFFSCSLILAVTLASLIGFEGKHPWPSIDLNNPDHAEYLRYVDWARALVAGISIGWVNHRIRSSFSNQPQQARPPNFAFFGGFAAQLILGNFWLKSVYGLDSLPCILFSTFAATFELAYFGLFDRALLNLVKFQGWIMNPGKHLQKLPNDCKVVVTFHENDEMISLDSSLKHFMEKDGENRLVIELDGPNPTNPNSYHMYELHRHELEAIKKFLNENN
jgi:pimeloyl-ACP methyl ester carboxylesterase